MSKPNDEPIAQQQQNQSGGPPNKRRKSDSPDEPVEMTNITDVNDNCLEHIFKQLTVSDLLNLADTSKLLNNAVRLAFASKYGKLIVVLDFMQTYRPRKHRSIKIDDEEIRVYDFPTCLKMMRCFGESITKLVIFFINVPERERDELDRYLNEYCAESVEALEYGRATLEHLLKSFTKVGIVCFPHGHFRCNPADIQRCFPNVRNLISNMSYAIDSIAGRFPHLEHLDIYVAGKRLEDFSKCLQLNPQLRSLRILGYNLNQQFLQILSECPKLENLYLEDQKTIALTAINSNAGMINFKTVRQFETDTCYLGRLDKANISVVFDHLDKLTISGLLNEDVVDFVRKHPFLSKFIISWDGWFRHTDNETLVHLAEALPSVKDVRMKCTMSADGVLDLMSKCKLLEHLECHLDLPNEYDILRGSLGTEWRSSIDEYTLLVALER